MHHRMDATLDRHTANSSANMATDMAMGCSIYSAEKALDYIVWHTPSEGGEQSRQPIGKSLIALQLNKSSIIYALAMS